ncbi:2-methylisocitrate lyase [Legionella geestiana]|uniref:2-methylisocitrate lyase n=1 Tax=Legionella geestiana TaxID=45065 RepID=A0A0W0TPF9_9GAMM|nr:methylisocitrate lyase [Legionella geestiana]KTC97483.1 2-methylisocitrate lyase [Legionella geestiana]QBS13311.1 methylisocitrate lyase [Legionella geestiana]QDQ40907.1 methylisocitrate lyase [Legionella geestiana]STX54160.1 2-methylisocitrate lyase [Legionella geestiana]
MRETRGKRLRQLVEAMAPLQVVGAVNAYCAMLAESAGCKALYLSGAGVANASFGLPDLGMTGLSEVLEDARRLNAASSLPLLVDVDTGFGNAFTIARTVKLMEQAGVAAIHIEDQVLAKRCGHRPNKAIVSREEMGDRIRAAVDARTDPDFVIMARTDAYAVQGMQAAIDRALWCVELGADMIFPEALTTLEQYREFVKHVPVPVLANLTEFGKTPLFSLADLKDAGVKIALYPLSAFRAMSKAALAVYEDIAAKGTQAEQVPHMQTREELYGVLGYHAFEEKLDRLYGERNE